MMSKRLARLLYLRRSALHLTFREAAKLAGVSAATFYRVESGRSPDVDTALKLCAWLGLSVEEAVTGKLKPDGCADCVEARAKLDAIRFALGLAP